MKQLIGSILVVLGSFFAFLPHEVHVRLGFYYVDHPYHVLFGIVCLVAGGFLLCGKRR